MSESQTPMVDAAEFAYCDDLTDLVVGSSLARELESELTATRARLAELEGIAERLSSDLKAVQEEQHGDVFAASIRDFTAYKEGKK